MGSTKFVDSYCAPDCIYLKIKYYLPEYCLRYRKFLAYYDWAHKCEECIKDKENGTF